MRLLLFCVVTPPPQSKPYGDVPPVTLSVIVPLFPPLQATILEVEVTLMAVGATNVAEVWLVHPKLSVTVTA